MLLNDYPHIGGKAVKEGRGQLWEFLTENSGAFIVPFAEYISRLYFPLLNPYGMKSSITPELKGDIASSFEHFLTAATVTEELHRNVSGRNGWISITGQKPWSVSGNSVFQKANKWADEPEESEVEGRIGAFILRRRNVELGIETEVKVFVPSQKDYVELSKISIKNISDQPQNITYTAATAIFARHADNFRDHRQVTTMFQKVKCETHGVSVSPKIVHNEHGHSENKVTYSVLGYGSKGEQPKRIWPLMYDFIGEGGSLDNPEALYRNSLPPQYPEHFSDGKEAVGAFSFAPEILQAGEVLEYVILHGITENAEDIAFWKEKYGSVDKFDEEYKKNLDWWAATATSVKFNSGERVFDNWTKWVTFQLLCRQVFGNSYLPDFGYGGDRGWRDLWQDLLSIFLVHPQSAREEMLNNFKGVRVDGSNATIIGSKPGEFIADRNNVPRIWCDHGAWPVFVLNFYIQQTSDFAILDKQVSYWKDKFSFRCAQIDTEWKSSDGFNQLTVSGDIYEGSILEHILLQQLTAFFNVGDNNNLKLEGGDWNDTLDMAREKGESVCFHAFYANNLATIAELLETMREQGREEIELLGEIEFLLDSISGNNVDYENPKSKNERLNLYLSTVEHKVSGVKIKIPISELISDLNHKSAHIKAHINQNEWKSESEESGFYNGHYDNLGNQIHGFHEGNVCMDLTSQVIPVMSDVANKTRITALWKSANRFLKDADSPGLRICTEFKNLDLGIGRITGFTYGQKEHGSKWSQQMIMFSYGLYKQGFVEEGFQMFKDVYDLCTNSSRSLIFPGLPSFFGPEDRGAYAYLTGSSTWLILTLTTEIFGVDAKQGDLFLKPKLNDWFFDENGSCSIKRNLRDIELTVKYYKKSKYDSKLSYINRISINKESYMKGIQNNELIISYKKLLGKSIDGRCLIEVYML